LAFIFPPPEKAANPEIQLTVVPAAVRVYRCRPSQDAAQLVLLCRAGATREGGSPRSASCPQRPPRLIGARRDAGGFSPAENLKFVPELSPGLIGQIRGAAIIIPA
jgi:hypothetical protein